MGSDEEDLGRKAEAASRLQAAGAKLDAMLQLSEDGVDAAAEDFERLRRREQPSDAAGESIDDAWTDEIGSRVDDILSGKVKTIPHDEVRAKLAADRAERDAAREN